MCVSTVAFCVLCRALTMLFLCCRMITTWTVPSSPCTASQTGACPLRTGPSKQVCSACCLLSHHGPFLILVMRKVWPPSGHEIERKIFLTVLTLYLWARPAACVWATVWHSLLRYSAPVYDIAQCMMNNQDSTLSDDTCILCTKQVYDGTTSVPACRKKNSIETCIIANSKLLSSPNISVSTVLYPYQSVQVCVCACVLCVCVCVCACTCLLCVCARVCVCVCVCA